MDAPQLIAYADRFGGSLHGLADILGGPLRDTFGGVHVLPFFRPYDGADAGFDPEDHTMPDPRLGTWADVAALARTHSVTADVIVNHMSVRSEAFRDVRSRGDASPYRKMFLTMGSVFPDGATEDELTAIYRPRPGLPFTAMTLGGRPHLVWTTFTADQVDLDIREPATWAYLTGIVDRLTDAGVTVLRLDAVGYVGKQPGTNCFMTGGADEFVRRLRAYANERGARVLLEVHGHYQQQIALAPTVDLVYDFALPPLVLHALHARDAGPLSRWLAVRPANAVTVLDTHDGIGIVDVYYVGLLAGRNDVDLLRRTGVGRDVNRHHYTRDEIGEQAGDTTIELRWRHGADCAELHVDLRDLTHRITYSDAGVTRTAGDVLELADLS